MANAAAASIGGTIGRPIGGSDAIVAFRDACDSEHTAQEQTISAYTSWIAEHAPQYVDYDGLIDASTPPLDPSDAALNRWRHAAMICETAGNNDRIVRLERKWRQREAERCRLARDLIRRTPTSLRDISETVEVLRYLWGWHPGHYGEELIDMGCADDIEALLASVETLAAQGGANV